MPLLAKPSEAERPLKNGAQYRFAKNCKGRAADLSAVRNHVVEATLYPPKPMLIVAKGPWKLRSLVLRVSMPPSMAPKKKSAW